MRLEELWEQLKPVCELQSLLSFSLEEGFTKNPHKTRKCNLGVNITHWVMHAQSSKNGDNPEIRLIFFRLLTLLESCFHVVVVFDGPQKPNWMCEAKVDAWVERLKPGIKEIVEALGFEWREAPGAADAELAHLNETGAIDVVLTDSPHACLFGALTISNNWGHNLPINTGDPLRKGKDDKNHLYVRIVHVNKFSFGTNGAISFALCTEEAGLSVFVGTERLREALVDSGLGVRLCDAVRGQSRETIESLLVDWRKELISFLHRQSNVNSRSLANKIGNLGKSFPNIDLLISCVDPLTSSSPNVTVVKGPLAAEPNLGTIAAVCERYFEWGYRDLLIKRFRSLLWPGIVLRIFLCAAVELDRKTSPPLDDPTTSQSSFITQKFSSCRENPINNHSPFFVHISQAKPTNNTPAHRVGIKPLILIRLAEAGLLGTRQPPDKLRDDNVINDSELEETQQEPGRIGSPADEQKELRLRIPAVLTQLVIPSLVSDLIQEKVAKISPPTVEPSDNPRGSNSQKAKKGKARQEALPNSKSSCSQPATKSSAKLAGKQRALATAAEGSGKITDYFPSSKPQARPN
ncbi:hypothetical protein MIND_00424700 [Mycena indigotica]|uniref:Holliday junction resolvase Gen1 C-terminal domain-containing protein n=1 Tax=Mycena indigotica TaxID=2126181 RepID=A0A8H6SUC5_9AGAR|nr:uncharacterized protein MIND_00424700 [Mycena indigotica]KAF7306335.1 hypothetical protein MIND_00424700 [Mycena indigotica]